MHRSQRSIKTEKTVLAALGEVTQKEIANFMQISEATVSRITPNIAQYSDFLTALGLKVVPESAHCTSAERMQTLKHLADVGLRYIDKEEEEF